MCAPPELRFLGITEFWAARFHDAERHLDEGVTLARRTGRPFLEFSGLVFQAGIELFRSFTRAAERSRQAIELAERQGWTDEPVACYAYSILADVPAWQGAPRRQRPGGGASSAPSDRKLSPWRRWRSTTSAGGSSWPEAGTPARWPRSGPPSGWPGPCPRSPRAP